MLERALSESGFDSRRIDLERLERAAMRGVSALPTLHALRSRGLTLTLDDFGSGVLVAQPPCAPADRRALKIDRSFVERIGEPHGEAITRTIIAMARTLGLRIIAEGGDHRTARFPQEGAVSQRSGVSSGAADAGR
jgi:EAL domain-containing protein (putative c-di-GMP-specific phosphodiesterase class I)